MSALDRLHRFGPTGRYQGFVVVDRPLEEYADRIGVDLTDSSPPDPPIGYCAYLVDGAWVLRQDPMPPAPPSPAVMPIQPPIVLRPL